MAKTKQDRFDETQAKERIAALESANRRLRYRVAVAGLLTMAVATARAYWRLWCWALRTGDDLGHRLFWWRRLVATRGFSFWWNRRYAREATITLRVVWVRGRKALAVETTRNWRGGVERLPVAFTNAQRARDTAEALARKLESQGIATRLENATKTARRRWHAAA